MKRNMKLISKHLLLTIQSMEFALYEEKCCVKTIQDPLLNIRAKNWFVANELQEVRSKCCTHKYFCPSNCSSQASRICTKSAVLLKVEIKSRKKRKRKKGILQFYASKSDLTRNIQWLDANLTLIFAFDLIRLDERINWKMLYS